MFGLRFRYFILLVLFGGLIFAIVATIGTLLGAGGWLFYTIITVGTLLVQYFLGPVMVEMSMKVRKLSKEEAPELFNIVEELASNAKIPMPKVGISETNLPNAFAYGRGRGDGHVCVTRGILKILNKDELKAVLGHEISHIKNRDVAFITFLSAIPMIIYSIAMSLMWSRNSRDRDNNNGNSALLGIIFLLLYYVSNLLVLYASRIREYYADLGSVSLGSAPSHLASALFKLVYGCAKTDENSLHMVEGTKAFFLNDPSNAKNEIKDLKNIDLDGSGTISHEELDHLSKQKIKVGFGDKIMEAFSTHPNMLKRIKALSDLNKHMAELQKNSNNSSNKDDYSDRNKKIYSFKELEKMQGKY